MQGCFCARCVPGWGRAGLVQDAKWHSLQCHAGCNSVLALLLGHAQDASRQWVAWLSTRDPCFLAGRCMRCLQLNALSACHAVVGSSPGAAGLTAGQLPCKNHPSCSCGSTAWSIDLGRQQCFTASRRHHTCRRRSAENGQSAYRFCLLIFSSRSLSRAAHASACMHSPAPVSHALPIAYCTLPKPFSWPDLTQRLPACHLMHTRSHATCVLLCGLAQCTAALP
jgi:hypothetical protein